MKVIQIERKFYGDRFGFLNFKEIPNLMPSEPQNLTFLENNENTKLSQIFQLLALDDKDEQFESQPLSHIVRCSLFRVANFLLHSHGKFADDLVPMLLRALSALPHMKWIDDGLLNKSDRIPVQEQFAFCFNTSLSDLAAHLPRFREQIVSAQCDALACSVSSVYDLLEDKENLEHNHSHVVKLMCYVLGLTRSIGRFSTDYDTPLISLIFPLPMDETKKLKGNSGGEIIHRISTDEFTFDTPENSEAILRDQTRLIRMYNKLGASFLVHNFTGGLKLEMSSQDLEKLFDSVQRLMDSKFLETLDEISGDIFQNGGSVKRNPYKSMSEIVILCCLTLLKDVLVPYQVSKDSPVSEKFAKEIGVFSKAALQKLDSELQSLQHASEPAMNGSTEVSRQRLNIQSATVSLQLIAWAVIDDIDADTICTEIINPSDEVQLKDLSFLCVEIDRIHLPNMRQNKNKLRKYGFLSGYELEYSFPILDAVSKSTKTAINVEPVKYAEPVIIFKNSEERNLVMNRHQVEHLKKAELTIYLLVNMSVNGRHTTRPLAKCNVRLADLIFSPYIIKGDFDFVGDDYEGTAEIRIYLGSRNKVLMEKLTGLRGDRSLEDTFIVTEKPVGRRTRSRSSSRCRAHSSASSGSQKAPSVGSRRPYSATSSVQEPPILRPQQPQEQQFFGENFLQRSRIHSSSSIGSDSVFVRASEKPRVSKLKSSISDSILRHPRASSIGSDSVFVRASEKPRILEDHRAPESSRITRQVTESFGASTVGDTVEEVSRHGGKYYLEVTVHEAVGLPLVEDESGRITRPSSFVSILGRDGDLCSPVYRNCRDPHWNFVARFAISAERRNLVVKVNHRGVLGDSALGYVTIPLPTTIMRKSVNEMTEFTRKAIKYSSQVPMLTISVENIRSLDENYENYRTSSRRTMSLRSTQSSPPPRENAPQVRIKSPPILESSEVIKKRMQKCMADFERL